MAQVTKRAGAPAGSFTVQVADGSFTFDDTTNLILTVSDSAANNLTQHPYLQLVGGSALYAPAPIQQDVFLSNGVLSYGSRTSPLAVNGVRVSERIRKMVDTSVAPGLGLSPPLMTSLPAITFNAAQQYTGQAYQKLTGTFATAVPSPLSRSGTPNPKFAIWGGPYGNLNFPFDGNYPLGAQVGVARPPALAEESVGGGFAAARTWTPAFDTESQIVEFNLASAMAGSTHRSFRLWVDEQPNCQLCKSLNGSVVSGSPLVSLASTAGMVAGQEIMSQFGGTFFAANTYVSVVGGTIATLSGDWSSGVTVPVTALAAAVPSGTKFTAGGQSFTTTVNAAAGATSMTVTAAPTANVTSGSSLTGTNTVTMSSNATSTLAGTGVGFVFGYIQANAQFAKIDFGSRRMRRIQFEIETAGVQNSRVAGFGYDKTATLLPPQIQTSKLYFISDSFGDGGGSLGFAQSLFRTAGRILGFADISTANSCSTTGATTPGGQGYGAFTDAYRLQHIVDSNPDVIVIPFSQNDAGASYAAILAAYTTVVSFIRTNLPAARLVLTECLFPGVHGSGHDNVDAAANAIGATFGLPVAKYKGDPAGVWVTGTGNIGGVTGDGSADLYLNNDLAHYSPAGHDFAATRLARALAPLLGIRR